MGAYPGHYGIHRNECVSVDDLHLRIVLVVLGCALEQKAHGLQWVVLIDGPPKQCL